MKKEKYYKALPLEYLKSIGRVEKDQRIECIVEILNKEEVYSRMKITSTYSVQIKNRKKKLKVVDLESVVSNDFAWCIPKNWLVQIK